MQEENGKKRKATVKKESPRGFSKKFYRKLKNCTYIYIDVLVKVDDGDELLFDYGTIVETKTQEKKKTYLIRIAAFAWKQLEALCEHENVSIKEKHVYFCFKPLRDMLESGQIAKEAFIDWKDYARGLKDKKALGSKLYAELTAGAINV